MFVSVAMCTYNGAPYICEQLDSILQQTHAVQEIIVHDDHSTDETIAILQEYANQYPELIRLHLSKVNQGAVRNFEKCIGLCQGDIIFLSDQDDRWHKDKVEKMLSFFNAREDVLMLFTDGNLIDEKGQLLNATLWQKWKFDVALRAKWKDHDAAFDDLIRNNNKVTGATVAISSKLKERIFPFRSHAHYWHDAWIALYAAKEKGLYYLETSLIDYRVHDKQLVGIGNGITLRKNEITSRTNRYSLKNLIRKVQRGIRTAIANK